jgi:hypothetical protein
VEDLAERRHKEARKWFGVWLAGKLGADKTGTMTDEDREELVVSKLLESCGEEIVLALNEDPVSRVFCDLWIIVDFKHSRVNLVDDAGTVRAGVSRAMYRGLRSNGADDIVTLLRSAVADELAERRDERIKRWISRRPKDFLPDLLDMVRCGEHCNVASFGEWLWR